MCDSDAGSTLSAKIEEPPETGFRERSCLTRPDRSDGASHRPAHEKQHDPELLNELCRQVFAFSSPGECGRRGNSECSQQEVASDGVR